MLVSDRHLENMDPKELRRVLTERNDAFRQMLEHEQRSLVPTIVGALVFAVAIAFATVSLVFWLNASGH